MSHICKVKNATELKQSGESVTHSVAGCGSGRSRIEQGETVHKQIGPHGPICLCTDKVFVKRPQVLSQVKTDPNPLLPPPPPSDRRTSNVLVEASLCISMKELATADP